jgi:uncharacterized protein (UPF0147 family)
MRWISVTLALPIPVARCTLARATTDVKPVERNIPRVVAEARAVLAQEETALMTNDIPILEALSRDHPRSIRLGVSEILVGIEAIRRSRRARTGDHQSRERLAVPITTVGRDVAVTNIVCRRIATGMIGARPRSWRACRARASAWSRRMWRRRRPARPCSAEQLAAWCRGARVPAHQGRPRPDVEDWRRCPTMWW